MDCLSCGTHINTETNLCERATVALICGGDDWTCLEHGGSSNEDPCMAEGRQHHATDYPRSASMKNRRMICQFCEGRTICKDIRECMEREKR